MNLESLSSTGLLFAFIFYTLSFFVYVLAIVGSRFSRRTVEQHRTRWGWIGFYLNVAGLVAHFVYFFARWAHGGHIPTSNMYEFLTFFSLTISFAFTVFFLIFRNSLLGLFSTPLTLIMIAYAAVFPKDVQPLIPGLQSKWLMIHVTTAALGEAFLAIGFVAGVMYLLRTIDYSATDRKTKRQQRGMEVTLYFILVIVTFVTAVFAFNAAGYEAQFVRQTVTISNGENIVNKEQINYVLPPIVQPNRADVVSMDSFLGLSKPLFTAPEWMKGVNSARKLNTVIWSLLLGLVGYWLLRLALRRPLGAVLGRVMSDIDETDLDEISYRTIAIGFPIFTLGALIFAMIWAAQAWGRFWGWDPKETWALITWLFYAAYLHLRLSRGWHGSRSAWMAVIGFMFIMFTLVGVNLMLAGLHSYAGV